MGERLFDKLARLRREPAPSSSAPSSSAPSSSAPSSSAPSSSAPSSPAPQGSTAQGPTPMGREPELPVAGTATRSGEGAAAPLDAAQLRRTLGRARSSIRDAAAPEAAASTLAPRTAGDPLGLVSSVGAQGEYVARRTLDPIDSHHGSWRYEEVREVDPSVFRLLTGDAQLGSLSLERALYLDTETTGLEGGAGTYVFLVGLGWFEDDRFVVEQTFLRGPEDEPAMLAAVAERIRAAPALVSFFGKVFDRHRLEDKLRIHGLGAPFEGRPHLDLCFPFRRLVQRTYGDGRLQTLERHLLGLTRSDDLPGSQAPAAWFDYLAGRAHRLEGVFRHNLDDVRSLAVLAAYLGRVNAGVRACGTSLVGPRPLRTLALARAHAAMGEDSRALALYRELLSDGESEGHLAAAALAAAARDEARLQRRLLRTERRRSRSAPTRNKG